MPSLTTSDPTISTENMPSTATTITLHPALSLPLLTTCNITLPLPLHPHTNNILPNHGTGPPTTALVALGPSFPERDILQTCCQTFEITKHDDAQGTPCLHSAACTVRECNEQDPVVACIGLLRREWKVEGPWVCLEGRLAEKKGGGGRVGVKGWFLAGVVFVGAVIALG